MRDFLEKNTVSYSAPCRIDFGGTLDISTFFYPLRTLNPVTFNIALDLRTTITLRPWTEGRIKITSVGFDATEFRAGEAPLTHPMGLMFSICDYFGAEGVHVDIRSESPPRSALGGSSVAAVTLIASLMVAGGHCPGGILPLDRIVMLAYGIESSVLRVPCGIQDQLAAAYGGVNAWEFGGEVRDLPYRRRIVVGPELYGSLEKRIIAAYCGEPHESVNINGRWVNHFMTGHDRSVWREIIACCNRFTEALALGDYGAAAVEMNHETALRTAMTPDVLDAMGKELAEAAVEGGCGARFTGAGGGGCIWAMGEQDRIESLKVRWETLMGKHRSARFLPVVIDGKGLRRESVD
jgi:D-glycero-alpha-D-manno-heptose-7-phosphate kinase